MAQAQALVQVQAQVQALGRHAQSSLRCPMVHHKHTLPTSCRIFHGRCKCRLCRQGNLRCSQAPSGLQCNCTVCTQGMCQRKRCSFHNPRRSAAALLPTSHYTAQGIPRFPRHSLSPSRTLDTDMNRRSRCMRPSRSLHQGRSHTGVSRAQKWAPDCRIVWGRRSDTHHTHCNHHRGTSRTPIRSRQ